MPQSDRTLPPSPSLEQQQKQAKDLLRAWRNGDAEAGTRVRARLPDKQRLTLADAQFVLAREYGFQSWAALKAHIESIAGSISQSLHDTFRRAFVECNPRAIRELLAAHPEARAHIDAPLFPFGASPLGHFAGANNLEMVDVLLEFGADPNRRSDWWAGPFHPLHSARGAVAERLLEAGAIPDACAAANLDRIDLLRSLLDDDPARVHERGGDGQTPLHFARSRAVVDLLLTRGADIDARDIDHRSPPTAWMLERARGAGRYELAQYLVQRGAAVDVFLAAALGLAAELRSMLSANPELLDLRTAQGEYGEQGQSSYLIYFWTIGANLSPMQAAQQFEQPEALDVMRAFASPKQRFLAACAVGQADEARQLLRESPQLMNTLTGDDHRTLADAAWAPNPDAVALLMELGFDPAVTGPLGGNALHCAAWEGSVGAVQALLQHERGRALVNVRDAAYGGTPLGWCWHGAENCGNPKADYPAVARLLLDAGTEPDASWENVPDWLQDAIDATGDGEP